MGNVDMTANQKFMGSYSKHSIEFIREKPLFYAEQITFPLSTRGARIVDATGRRVKIAGGNWSGGHMCRHCVDGLECRPLRDIAMDIKYKFHMNCIRLTYSLQLFFDDNVIDKKYIKANPELIGKTSMEVFDYTIKVLTEVGIMVILNNHTSTSQWCCSNDDGDGLWWSYQYPENMFFQCSQHFAQRYKDNPLVIGIDLRNELRKAHGIEATWGDGNPVTDWYRAAKICGEKVLKIAPHWLIIVAGLNYQLDLTCIQKRPIQYSVPNKLVLSGHLYSFSWPPSWASFSYDAFRKKLFNSQTFVRGLGIPYIIGEFGNNKRDTLWNYLIRYLKQTDIDWIYWPIDGFKCDPDDPDKDQTYGIFTHDFMEIRNSDIFADLREIGAPPFAQRAKKGGQARSQNSQKERRTKTEAIRFEQEKALFKEEKTKHNEDLIFLKEEQEDMEVPTQYKRIKSNNVQQLRMQNKIFIAEEKYRSHEEISIESILSKAEGRPFGQPIVQQKKQQVKSIEGDKTEELHDEERKRHKIFDKKV